MGCCGGRRQWAPALWWSPLNGCCDMVVADGDNIDQNVVGRKEITKKSEEEMRQNKK